MSDDRRDEYGFASPGEGGDGRRGDEDTRPSWFPADGSDEGYRGNPYRGDAEVIGGVRDTEPIERAHDTEPLGRTHDTEPLGRTHDTEPIGRVSDTEPSGRVHDTEPLWRSGDTEPLFPLPAAAAGGAGSAGTAADLGATDPAATPPRQRNRRARWVAVPLAAALVGGGIGGWIGADVANNSDSGTHVVLGSNGTAAAVQTSSGNKSAPTSTTTAVAASILPSVVSINVRGSNQADTGSGVVLSDKGYILTNNHVIAAAIGGGSVSVTFNDGSSAAARIVGADQPSDLAVIKVAKSGLHAAALGSSSSVRVGDPVLAVGSPLGLSGTVTSGIISALHRPVDTTPEEQPQNPFDPFGGSGNGSSTSTLPTVINAIQTDAAINPGNSGGPLVNMAGQVIGINSAIATVGGSATGGQSGNIGVGFAIPIDQAKRIAGELIATGHADHPLIGVSITDATTSGGATTVVVRDVKAGGPAQQAGIKVGDRITAVNGTPVTDADSLIATVRAYQPGQTVKLTIVRDGKQQTVSVRLGDDGAARKG
jgi:putative serine protease PepD